MQSSRGHLRTVLLLALFALQTLSCTLGDFEHVPRYHNASDSQNAKRWYRIKNTSRYPWWSGSKIRYCFVNNAGDQVVTGWANNPKLSDVVKDAWKLWTNNGITSQGPSFKSGLPLIDCRSGNAPNVLMISVNTAGLMETSTGKIPADAANNVAGPHMSLDLDAIVNKGTLNPIVNIAHEIGHAWGLLHEHQRNDIWGLATYNGGGDQLITFNCQNMADYQAKLAAEGQDTMNLACTLRATAARIGFSASQILPIQGFNGVFEFDSIKGDRNPDWASIMWYGSKVGGAGVRDNRALVQVRADNGAEIPYNMVPSQVDVSNLMFMYPKGGPQAPLVPLGSSSSPFQTAFLAAANPGASCSI